MGSMSPKNSNRDVRATLGAEDIANDKTNKVICINRAKSDKKLTCGRNRPNLVGWIALV